MTKYDKFLKKYNDRDQLKTLMVFANALEKRKANPKMQLELEKLGCVFGENGYLFYPTSVKEQVDAIYEKYGEVPCTLPPELIKSKYIDKYMKVLGGGTMDIGKRSETQ